MGEHEGELFFLIDVTFHLYYIPMRLGNTFFGGHEYTVIFGVIFREHVGVVDSEGNERIFFAQDILIQLASYLRNCKVDVDTSTWEFLK